MASRKTKLTADLVKKAKTDNPKGEQVLDTELPGFGVQVLPTGRKTFFVRYGSRNRRRWMRLGTYGALTVQDAREAARKVIRAHESGDDPADQRKKRSKVPTFRQWAESYLEDVRARKKDPRHDERYLAMAIDQWGTVAIDEISRADVKAAMKDVQRRAAKSSSTTKVTKTTKVKQPADRQSLRPSDELRPKYDQSTTKGYKPGITTANRWLASVRACLQEAYRDEVIPANPAMGVRPFPENAPRARVLTPDEWTRLEAALAAEEDPFVRAAFRLLVETGARKSEVLRAQWDDIDLKRSGEVSTWRIPSSKAGKPQTVPLASQTVAMLRRLPRVGPFLIPGRDAGKPRSDLKRPWERIVRAAQLDGVTIHDIRRSFGLQAAQKAGLHVASKLLRHSDIRVTERVYAPLGLDELAKRMEEVQRPGDVVAFPQAGGDE